MKFEEVLAHARDGKKFKNGGVLYRVEDGVLETKHSKDGWIRSQLTLKQCMASDWIVVEEPELWWRRAVCLKSADSWHDSEGWHKTKDSFMEEWENDHKRYRFGPWESRTFEEGE